MEESLIVGDFEIFKDEDYYGMYQVRPVGSWSLHHALFFNTRDEAIAYAGGEPEQFRKHQPELFS